MRRNLALGLVGLIVLVFVSGCGEAPQERWVSHLEEVVSILEKHQEAPAVAAEEIRKYTERRATDLAAVREAMKAQRESLSAEDREEFARKLVAKLAPVMQRYMKLIARPQLAGSKEILEAMAPYGP